MNGNNTTVDKTFVMLQVDLMAKNKILPNTTNIKFANNNSIIKLLSFRLRTESQFCKIKQATQCSSR